MTAEEDFTEAQLEVLHKLPDTRGNIAEELGISRRAVRGRMKGVEETGGQLERDRNDVWYWAGEENLHRITSRHKTTVTKKANAYLTELEAELKQFFKRHEPATAAIQTTESHEDVVIHLTDNHFGQIRYNDRGEQIFNTDIAERRVRKIIQTALRLIKRHRDAGWQFDNCHLLLGGDAVTNENIYDHQPYNIDRTLDEQIHVAAECYYRQVERLAREFETVQVVTQVGNHGEIRASGQSKQANADDIAYGRLDAMVRISPHLDNVHFVRNDSTNYVNFRMRGWRGHLRHGQDSLVHIGTSSGKKRWLQWLTQHDFDIGFRGHYHEFKVEQVHDCPVIMSGSICPPGDYEESLAEWSSPGATIMGVSDERPMTWFYPIDFQ